MKSNFDNSVAKISKITAFHAKSYYDEAMYFQFNTTQGHITNMRHIIHHFSSNINDELEIEVGI